MTRSKHTQSVASQSRPGFTLVELLIVMTIIAVLAALTISASMRFIAIAEVRTTETLVHKLHDALDKHWKAVVAKAQQEPYEKIPGSVITMAGNDANRARVIYVKLRLKQEFPMNFREILMPDPKGLPSLPTYVKAVTGKGDSAERECSACLLLALSQARSGIVTNMEDFGAEFVRNLNESGTPNDPKVFKGFVDSWNQPVVFTRWPTNDEVNALNPAKTGSQTRFADPQDPTGTLLNPQWFNSSNRKVPNGFEALCHVISPNPNVAPSVRQAYYTVPVVWSKGPDKQPGLTLDTMLPDGTGKGYDNDNIYSFRLRLGGS